MHIINSGEKEKLIERFNKHQVELQKDISLSNRLRKEEIKYIAGIDLGYWKDDSNTAVCCIVIYDYQNREIVEQEHTVGRVFVPYIPGYLSFRELPLICETYRKLKNEPDLLIFDGNGYLHYRNLGIATHAAIVLDKPSIGVAKSYLKIDHVDFVMPSDRPGAYEDIVIRGQVFGRALRTHSNTKPVFVSVGNWIDLDTATGIVMDLVRKESRLPVPVRIADIETRRLREYYLKERGVQQPDE